MVVLLLGMAHKGSMKKSIVISIILALALVGVSLNATYAQTTGSKQTASSQLLPVSQLRSTGDNYGYTLLDAPFADFNTEWVDTTSGTAIFDGSTLVDFDFSDAINLGFTFPFYEKTYTQIYVSDNGILTFSEGTTASENKLIPFNPSPNAFVAPFWDDLVIGQVPTSTVKYVTGSDINHGGYIAVGYHNVSRKGENQ